MFYLNESGSFLICLFVFLTGDVLDVTGFNMQPVLQASDNTFFGGYKSSTDIDASIVLGRDVDTGTGPDWPPYPRGHRLMEGALGGRTTRIQLPASIGIQRIGAFYINATNNAGVSHKIITITLSSNGKITLYVSVKFHKPHYN